MLAAEVEELLVRGLSQCYAREFASRMSPRRLAINEIARRGGVFEAALSTVTTSNGVRTGFLIACCSLVCAARRSIGYRPGTEVARAGESLEVADRATMRTTEANRPAMTLMQPLFSMLGLESQTKDRTRQLPGFLFDMNKFFSRCC